MSEVHITESKQPNVTQRKPPARATLAQDEKLLVGCVEAAGMLSISCRALDYLVANKQLLVRRIGTRVLISVTELRRFSRSDHPEHLVGKRSELQKNERSENISPLSISTATKTATGLKRRKPPLGWLLQIADFYGVYGS